MKPDFTTPRADASSDHSDVPLRQSFDAEIAAPQPEHACAARTKSRKLLDQLADVLRAKHYAYRTEQAYVGWVRRFILFHDKRHPQEMSGDVIERFPTHLAVERHISASTPTQALFAVS